MTWWSITGLFRWMVRCVWPWLRRSVGTLLIRYGLWCLMVSVTSLLRVLITGWKGCTEIEISSRWISSCCLFWWSLLIVMFRVCLGFIVPFWLIVRRRRNKSY